MTINSKKEILSTDEWKELTYLKDAIEYDISQVHYQKLEEFTEYLVRSIKERGG
jgi:predicted solute-binding protein